MELYASGFNGHGQLNPKAGRQSIDSFHKIAEGIRIRILGVTWCATILDIDGLLTYHGYHNSGLRDCMISTTGDVKSVFGDVEGIYGALAPNGTLLELVHSDTRPDTLHFRAASQEWMSSEKSLVEHVSIAGNGQVAMILRRPQIMKLGFSLYMFDSMAGLKAHPESDCLAAAAVLPAVTLLESTATSFIALTENGTVLSWGSPLHPHLLARQPTAETPAEFPHPVSFLQGLLIRKIAAGGWICVAVSQENDLYIWGGQPEKDASGNIDCLPQWREGEDVRLVDIDGGVDIVDAAVGEEHVIALTESGEIWVTGQGHEGQLGLGSNRQDFEQDWVRVNGWGEERQVVQVEAAGWNSFVVAMKG